MKIRAFFVAALLIASSSWGQFPFLMAHFSGGGPGAPNAGCCATAFDGSTQYLTHSDSSGWVDSKQFTFSFWIKRNETGTNTSLLRMVLPGGFRVAFTINANDVLTVSARNSAGTTVLTLRGTTPIDDTEWHHVLWSIDLSSAAKRHLYVDDAADTFDLTTPYTNSAIDFSVTGYYVGSNGATADLNGAISEFWFDSGTYIDLGTEGLRRDFIDAAGNPVDLGADGSVPTGTAPEVYLSDGRTNTGSTADFAAVNSPAAVAGPNP